GGGGGRSRGRRGSPSPPGRGRRGGRRGGSAGRTGGRPGRVRAGCAAGAAPWTCGRRGGRRPVRGRRVPPRAAAGCSVRGRRSGSWRAYLLVGLFFGSCPAGAESQSPPRGVVEGGEPVGEAAGGRRGEVAGGGEGGRRHEVPVPQPVPYGKVPQGGREEAGGERVAGAGGGDDVDVQGGHEGGGAVRVGAAVGVPVQGDGSGPALLDDDEARFGQGLPHRAGAVQPPCLACLVVTDEDDVRPAGQFQQHLGAVSVAPQAGAVVDVEGDQGPSGAACGQFPHQVQAAGGEGRRDARQVQDASGAHGRQVDTGGAHRGGGRAGPVVGDLVGVVGPVAGGAEVDAGGAVRV